MIDIIEKPIIFNEERITLTQQYRAQHYDIQEQSICIQPQMIVLHWTEIADLNASFQAMNDVRLSGRDDIDYASALNVSAHFLVDRDGSIYQLMPDHWMARHTIGLNNIALGIENVGGVNHQEDLTDAQVSANAKLVRHLQTKFPTITHIIGHFEYANFKNTKLWQEKNPAYFNPKVDPGEKFMAAVRACLDN